MKPLAIVLPGPTLVRGGRRSSVRPRNERFQDASLQARRRPPPARCSIPGPPLTRRDDIDRSGRSLPVRVPSRATTEPAASVRFFLLGEQSGGELRSPPKL